jgi:predicted  nucleic acid-binding Zn-ribbon protein
MSMHADLVKLLDLQAKDAVVADVERRLEALQEEFTMLDQALEQSRAGLEAARRTAADAGQRRDELEAKIESYRLLQDRRRLRLEHVRNPKEASTLMAELDLARSVVAKEENDWIRSADTVAQLERTASEEEQKVAQVEEGQVPERSRLDGRRAELQAELAAANASREAAAAQLDRPLRTRYERLRKSRLTDVVVPLVSNGCGACHTAVPMNRRSQIRSGAVIEGCEACGAILYPAEEARSAG